jgi:hypothetical protein
MAWHGWHGGWRRKERKGSEGKINNSISQSVKAMNEGNEWIDERTENEEMGPDGKGGITT